MIDLIKEIQLLYDIQNTSSSNDKIELLSRYKNNEVVKLMLRVALDKNLVTSLGEKKLSKTVNKTPDSTIEISDLRTGIIKILDYVISKECSGKDNDIVKVQTALSYYSEEERYMLNKIIAKTLNIGINKKNVNKAIPDLIPIFNVMLAYNADNVDNDDIYAFTVKLDGNRFVVKCENGTKTAYSREGLKLEYFDDFLSKLNLIDGYMYDGEILPTGTYSNSKERYDVLSSIMRTKENKDPNSIEYHIFDMIPIDEFYEGVSKASYKERRAILDTISDSPFQRKVKILYEGKISDKEVRSIFEKVVYEEHEEGLMGNKIDAKYQGKRTKDILKFKEVKTVDLRCIGIEEGKGKYENNLGSIVVTYKGNNVNISGMSDYDKERFWKNPELIVGKIVEIKYFSESKNKKNNNISLRFPRFSRIREKNIESYE